MPSPKWVNSGHKTVQMAQYLYLLPLLDCPISNVAL